MLTGVGICKNFGGLDALSDIDFHLEKGEVLSLLGPNGSGKTTLFNVVTGFYRPDSGTISFETKKISGLSPNEIARMGIGRTFQNIRIFQNITVVQNVAIAVLYGNEKIGDISKATSAADRWLTMCGLKEKADRTASSLNLIDRKLLELARVLAIKPKVVLLDELTAGLNPTEAQQTISLLKKIRNELNLSIFMIEHVMSTVLELSDRVIVLNHGRKIYDGDPEEAHKDQGVVEAYLGRVS